MPRNQFQRMVFAFIAAFLYYPYYAGFSFVTLLVNWLKLMCFNFPFAYFTQIFFIQPVVRRIFKFLFRKDIAKRNSEEHFMPENEQEAVADVFRRMDEIQEELAHERRRRKALEKEVQYINK